MKKSLMSGLVLLTMVFSVTSFTPVSLSTVSPELKVIEQGSGCPYVCREEYKICVKKKRKKCRAKLNSCLRMCPK